MSKYGSIFTCKRFGNYINYRFRIDPVPGIRVNRRYGSIWKYPKTIQEKRLSFAYDGFVRSKRSSNNLPDLWDSIHVSNLLVKSWKRTKKRKQWE